MVAGLPIPTANVGAILSTSVDPVCGYDTTTEIVLASAGSGCTAIVGIDIPNATYFSLEVGSHGSALSSIPGTYPVHAIPFTATVGPGAAVAYFTIWNASGNGSALNVQAMSGTVTITAVQGAGLDNGTVSGSADLYFPNGDHVTGTFSVTVCTPYTTAGELADAACD
jgi:hypothetical protein